jgi:indolepyruvate ferredoxin oxidoreductase
VYQRGLLPIGEVSILRAIELNGAAIEATKQSFNGGRLAAIQPGIVAAAAIPQAARPDLQRLSESLDEMIDRRAKAPG